MIFIYKVTFRGIHTHEYQNNIYLSLNYKGFFCLIWIFISAQGTNTCCLLLAVNSTPVLLQVIFLQAISILVVFSWCNVLPNPNT